MIAAVRGNLSVATHGKYVVLQPGQVLVLHEPGAYTVQAVADCLCMEVQVQGELADRLLLDLLEDDSVVFSRSASAVRETVMTLSVLEDEHPPVSGDTASAYAYSLLIKLREDHMRQQEEEDHLPPLVESAIAIIQEEFPFLEGLDELAERLEVSKAHLIRTFTKKTGISPGKYITRVRIEYAKLLLQDEDASISYVAESSGFANANYFAKVFRRETGMSPTEYLETMPNRKEHHSRRVTQAIW
jgi:AraC-like DNA-binding protein